MGGILTYLAFVLLLSVWATGWLAMSAFIGSLLKVPAKLAVVAGLMLGPLGVLYVIYSGTRRFGAMKSSKLLSPEKAVPHNEDPFV